ncbi:MAG TPA: hypothetical protein VGH27_01625 [Streptosporangiaceae bacterium]|jgi:hypothetical protein
MSVTMDVDVGAVYLAARERLEERANVYRSHTEAEKRQAWLRGEELSGPGIYSDPYRAPGTLAEWLDDRIVERNSSFHQCPETGVLFAILAAAREGGATAAVAAVRPARQLDPRAQWTAYENVRSWRGHPAAAKFAADSLMNAVLAEWSRLRLAEEDPDGE